MKNSIQLFLCASICLVSLALGQTPPSYTVTLADPGTGPVTLGRGINDKGDTVTRSFNPAMAPGSADVANKRKKQGSFNVLAPVAGFTAAGPNDINNRGDAVGFSSNSVTNSTATLWKKNGQIVDLGTIPGFPASIANEISNSGIVAGVASMNINSSSADAMAFRWSKGTMTAITHSAYQFGAAAGVSANGTVAGQMWNVFGGPGRDLAGFVADKHNNVTILPTFPGGSFTALFDINNDGMAVGVANSGAGLGMGVFEHGTIYDNNSGTMTPVFPPAGFQVAALRRINDSGTAVGLIVNVMQANPSAQAAVYSDGQLWEMNPLVVQDMMHFWIILEVRDINNKGQISATAVDVASPGPAPVAVILNPVSNR
ncbi:MAG: putative HAF family extracellular repeat protein [Planctomycetota bacterium]|jgi:probable HAF family extracellular repeat protein